MLSLFRRALLGVALLLCASLAFAQGKNPVQQAGKYAVELRIPAGGIYAGEETDIEFRVTDTSKTDPVLGATGVIRAVVKGSVTMPIMPAMPSATPRIHSEGVPGDYGLVNTFPHGGDYRIALTITPPGEDKPFNVAFDVPVKDEDDSGKRPRTLPPFTLSAKTDAPPTAGKPVNLTVLVQDRKTGKIVTDFDTVHEMKMHLVIVRSDLGLFFHEHPTLNADGSFTGSFTFPTGGQWHLFADMAPAGSGSQVASAALSVSGPNAPTETLKPAVMPQVNENGMTLAMQTKALPARKTLPVAFTLKDSNGKPITDLQPWLGAMGHLILIEKDATTFVHSHPDESDPNNGKNGSLLFLARFPKPGVYKGWVQFQRGGEVKTIPFVVRATAQ